MDTGEKPSVLCVDDNPLVGEALRRKLHLEGSFHWLGWLSSAEGLAEALRAFTPGILLLDIDMPGPDPIDAAVEGAERSPHTQIIIFSSHVRPELVERALASGVWGYVSKNDGEDELLRVMRDVTAGQVAMSRQAREALGV